MNFPATGGIEGGSRIAAVALPVLMVVPRGRGVTTSTDFPGRPVGADDPLIALDNPPDIAGDAILSPMRKRERLRQLGSQDEKLLEALLTR